MHDEEGRDWIAVDKQEIVSLPHWYPWLVERYEGHPDLQKEFVDFAALFAGRGLRSAMQDYCSMSIDDVLGSENVLIRALGMLDRRLGKRRLRAIRPETLHPLARLLHSLRCAAENILLTESCDVAPLKHPAWPGALRKEEKVQKSQLAATRLTASKKTRKQQRLLALGYQQELAVADLDTAIAAEINAGFEQAASRETLLDVLRFVAGKSKLLKSAAHTRGVIQLARDAANWLRPLREWSPKSHNADRQFSSLARHLLANYDVPLFLDRAWLHGTEVEQGWFRHIGAGHNIQTAQGLPVLLTKRMAHCFLQAPRSYSIEAAIRWGQILALGGEPRLADAVRETRLAREFRDDEFWLSVLRFFIRNPMLDLVHVNPIVDYLWNQRYEPRVVFVERGVAHEVGPEQPNLSMRGRTVASVLREVERWHGRLGREASGGQLQWRKSPFREFEFFEGKAESRSMRLWRIRELLSSRELIAEGRRMQHCVASYASSCHSGRSSIWSMELETADGIEPMLTIEVNVGRKEMCQARGKRNRLPTDAEKDILRRWAQQENISVSIRF